MASVLGTLPGFVPPAYGRRISWEQGRSVRFKHRWMHHSSGIWLQAAIRIGRKISALPDCQLRTSNSACP
jgi:hypothetical protein